MCKSLYTYLTIFFAFEKPRWLLHSLRGRRNRGRGRGAREARKNEGDWGENPNLSGRVCIPCSHKIRNAAELYRFVEEAISATEDVSCENRNKRLLLTTIYGRENQGKEASH